MSIRVTCRVCESQFRVKNREEVLLTQCPTCGSENIARVRKRRKEPESNEETPWFEKPTAEKKPRTKPSTVQRMPVWGWWTICTAAVFLFAIGAVVVAELCGVLRDDLAFGLLALLIMLPASAFILIVSMVVSSSIVGGIEFGEVHVVIPKSLALLLVVNFVSLAPRGEWATIVIWYLGIFYLFELDWLEARVLTVVNWMLNFGLKILVFHLIPHLLSSGTTG
jgi:predicted RNA-binding Zn-ribbon protein involved in translation (DUF1610 family)